MNGLNYQSEDDSGISWTDVSIRMNSKRGRQQCAAKWYTQLDFSVIIPTNLITCKIGWNYSDARSTRAENADGVASMRVASSKGRYRSIVFRLSLQHSHSRIREMDLAADTGIDWGMLQAWFQNVWGAKTLRRKWALLKSSVDGFQNKTHRGLLMLRFLLTRCSACLTTNPEIITFLHTQYSSPA